MALTGWDSTKKYKITNILPTSANDDFTGNDGDAPNPLLWDSSFNFFSDSSLYVVDLNANRLRVSGDATAAIRGYAGSMFKLTGDYSVQVQVDRATAKATGDEILLDLNIDPYNRLIARTMGSDKIWAGSVVGGVWATSTELDNSANIITFKVERSGSNFTISFDTGGGFTTLESGTTFTADATVMLGMGSSSSNVSVGYLDNFQVNSGTIVWPELTDQYWEDVVLALPFDGADSSTTIPDLSNSGHTVTAVGNAHIETDQSKFGEASAYFDGSGDFLTLPTSTDFDLGDTYTIEFWIRPNSISGNFGILHRGLYTTSNNTWVGLAFSIRFLEGSCRFYFYGTTNANEQVINVASAFTAATWKHVAMVRSGTNGYVYIDGVLVGSITGLNTPAASTQTLRIGEWDYSSGVEYFPGYLDDIRITKGVARYTADFTPPIHSMRTSSTFQLPIVIEQKNKPDSANDDFTGNDGDAPNPLKWSVTSNPSATVLASNKLRMSGSLLTSAESIFELTGDFDIQVDLDIVLGPNTNYWTLGLRLVFPNDDLVMMTRRYDGSQRYTAEKYISGTWATIAGVSTSDTVCKLRITRSGSLYSFFYWNGSSWVANGTFSGAESNVIVSLEHGPWGTNPSFTGDFDNFTVNSGTIVWPDSYKDGSGITHFDASAIFDELNIVDPYFDNVVLALPFDGTDGSTTITDISTTPKTITVNGNTQIKTAQSKFGGTSCYFDGSGDYLAIATNTAFGFGTGVFTSEAWIYILAFPGDMGITDFRATGTGANLTFFIDGPTHKLATWDGSNKRGANGTTLVTGQWYHVALTRISNTFYGYLNGVLDFSGAVTLDFGTSKPLGIGGSNSVISPGSSPFSGYIDDLRITKGVARYTENFTPPTRSFSEETPTTGLLNKKIALEIGDTTTECNIEIPPDSWDWTNKSAMILATVPSLTSDTILNLYYDSAQDDNPNVTDVDPLPDAPTDPYELAVYDLALADGFLEWSFIESLIVAWIDEDYSSFPIGPNSQFFEAIYTLLTPYQNFKDLIYGLRLGAILNEHYGNAAVKKAFLNEYYGNVQELRKYLDEKYGDTRALVAMLNEKYNLSELLEKFVDLKYSISNDALINYLNLLYSVKDVTSAKAWMELIYAINAESVVEASDLIVTIDGTRVYPYHVTFEFNRDSYKAFAEIHLADQESYLLCKENQSILRIQDGIDDLYFEVEVPREMASLGETSYVIPAESKSRILERAARITREFGAGLASDIAVSLAAEYGITVTWSVTDWFIPAGNLYANDEAPIEVIRKLSAAIGAKLQPTTDGNLRVLSNMQYDTTVWNDATPTYYLTDQANFFSTSEDSQERDGYNKYRISNYTPADKSTTLEEVSVKSNEKILKGFKVPFDSKELLLLHSGGDWVGIEKFGETEETLTETVEIVSGQGSVSRPIYSITSYKYNAVALGAVTYNEDGTLTCEVSAQSLLEITYVTKYWSWRATSPNIEEVQFWVEEAE